MLSAIEDLDIAAQIRSSAAAVDGATDLNGLIKSLTPELKERATVRGAKVDIVLSRMPAICSLEQAVVERLMRRFCSALIDAALPRERIAIAVDCDVGQCLVTISRPQAMRGLSDAQLFGRDEQNPDVLASSFSLKLARGLPRQRAATFVRRAKAGAGFAAAQDLACAFGRAGANALLPGGGL